MVPVTYNTALADRIRAQLAGVKRVTEQEMFGGVSFLVAGHMCCGVRDDDLMVRVPPELHHDALVRPHTREIEMGGRSMRGLILVERDGLSDDADLELWVRLGLARAAALPPKPAKRAAKRAKRAVAAPVTKPARATPKGPAKATAKATRKRIAGSRAKPAEKVAKRGGRTTAGKAAGVGKAPRAATRKAAPASTPARTRAVKAAAKPAQSPKAAKSTGSRRKARS